jgi:hypothetical protein
MSPHPCEGCVLQEARGGRVCPAAHSAHGLADLEVQHRAERLHAAIVREAGTTPSLPELVRQEPRLLLPATVRLGLLAAPAADPRSDDSRKEILRVVLSRPVR